MPRIVCSSCFVVLVYRSGGNGLLVTLFWSLFLGLNDVMIRLDRSAWRVSYGNELGFVVVSDEGLAVIFGGKITAKKMKRSPMDLTLTLL